MYLPLKSTKPHPDVYTFTILKRFDIKYRLRIEHILEKARVYYRICIYELKCHLLMSCQKQPEEHVNDIRALQQRRQNYTSLYSPFIVVLTLHSQIVNTLPLLSI